VSRYLDFAGAVDYTLIGQTRLRELMNAGEIPFIKLGPAQNSPVRFRIEDLDAYMEHHYHPATAGVLVEPAPTKRGRRAV